MKKLYFLFLFCLTAVVVQAQVLITEVTDPDDNYRNKFVEICNRGETNVDISGWSLERYSNGKASSQGVTVDPDKILAPGECHVFLNSQSPLNLSCAQSTGIPSGNGNDVYELTDGANRVDIYGEVGVDGTGEPWEYKDSVAKRNGSVTSPNTTWTASEWIIESNANTADGTPCEDPLFLPVEMTSFTGFAANNSVVLQWSTATETENDHFIVERSLDGSSFTAIGKVLGNGTTQTEQNYEFVDANPTIGNNYYQLTQVDLDGTLAKSNVILVETNLNESQVMGLNANQLQIYLDKRGETQFSIYDVTGNLVNDAAFNANKGMQTIELQNSLRRGIYIVRVQQGTNTIVKKYAVQ